MAANRYEDMTGRQYGLLTVIGPVYDKPNRDNHRRVRWLCKCKCGKETNPTGSSLRAGLSKSCGSCYKRLKNVGAIPPAWFNKIQHNAKIRNLNFTITIEELANQYKKQEGKCYYSGLSIGLNILL